MTALVKLICTRYNMSKKHKNTIENVILSVMNSDSSLNPISEHNCVHLAVRGILLNLLSC